MLKTDTPEDLDRLKAIAEAAVEYVRLTNEPADGPGFRHLDDTAKAFDRLAALVAEGRKESADDR